MDDKLNFMEPLFEKAEKYGKTSYELFRLKSIDKMSNILSNILFKAILFFVFSLGFILLNIGIAIYLGELLGRFYYGFFCLALFYTFLGCIVSFFMNDKIKKLFQDSIISQMLK